MKSLCIECISSGCKHNGHEIKNVKKTECSWGGGGVGGALGGPQLQIWLTLQIRLAP